MIDGSKKCKRQLAFELQASRVFEKCSKRKLKILTYLEIENFIDKQVF